MLALDQNDWNETELCSMGEIFGITWAHLSDLFTYIGVWQFTKVLNFIQPFSHTRFALGTVTNTYEDGFSHIQKLGWDEQEDQRNRLRKNDESNREVQLFSSCVGIERMENQICTK